MNRELKFRVYDGKKFHYFELHNVIVSDNLLCQYKYPVQQFTGLVDKNNKEIYEGDIVSVICYDSWNNDDKYEVVYLVKWCPIHVGFRGFTKRMLDGKSSGSGMPTLITILGNIFENPELLNIKTTCISS